VLLVAALVAAVLVYFRAPNGEPTAVHLSPGRGRHVQVDNRLALSIPRGGVTQDSELTATPTTPADLPIAAELDGVSLNLSNDSTNHGEPDRAWTLTYQLRRPLPEEGVIFLVDDTETTGPSVFRRGVEAPSYTTVPRVVEGTLSKDRRTATFRVTRLSNVVLDAIRHPRRAMHKFSHHVRRKLAIASRHANHFVNDALGNRADRPRCGSRKTPEWVRKVTFPGHRETPIIGCATSTGSGQLLVKIADNRASPMTIASKAKPSSVTINGRSRSPDGRVWQVPGTAEVDLTYSLDLRFTWPNDAFRIEGGFTKQQRARALAGLLTGTTLDGDVARSLAAKEWHKAASKLCIRETQGVTGGDVHTSDVARFSQCMLEKGPEIAKLAKSKLPAARYAELAHDVDIISAVAKKANVVLAVVSTTTDVLDSVLTGLSGEASRQVTVLMRALPGEGGGPTHVVHVSPVDSHGELKPGYSTVTDGSPVECQPGSDAIGRAYRCSTIDPCWAAAPHGATQTVVCLDKPWSHTARRILVPGGLEPIGDSPAPVDFPWGVRLAGGRNCIIVQGAHSKFQGDVVDYSCDGDLVLLRPLHRAQSRWIAETAHYRGGHYTHGGLVTIDVAWYGSPSRSPTQ
jgi:hypothetical protein